MTIEEAVELVIQAGAAGRGGEVLVLDMGDAVRIADVAQMLATRSDRKIAIQYTGLRDGEKLHEVLFGAEEEDRRPVHPLISHVPAPPLAPWVVRGFDVGGSPDVLVQQLRAACRQPLTLLPSAGEP